MISPDTLADCLSMIVEQGMTDHPREAVGLICPDGTVFFLTNEADKLQEYLVSSDQLAAAFYAEDGVEDLGFDLEDVIVWHTHPSGFIGPSRGDLESRRQPVLEQIKHLVISLPNGETTYY